MNEEKCMDATINLSRNVENDFWFNVFKSQKNESLTHSFFFESFRSKFVFRSDRNLALRGDISRRSH